MSALPLNSRMLCVPALSIMLSTFGLSAQKPEALTVRPKQKRKLNISLLQVSLHRIHGHFWEGKEGSIV